MSQPAPVFVLLLVVALAGCGPTEGPIVYAEAPDPLSEGGVHPLTLDITVPDPELHGEGPYPAIFFIHGGGWRYGNLYDGFGEGVLQDGPERGYVAVSINYRLTLAEDEDGDPRFPWPAQIEDSRCALRWLTSHADEYGVDIDRVGLAGYSGGGHLALLISEGSDQQHWDADFCPNEGPIEFAAAFTRSAPTDTVQLWETTVDLGREWSAYALGVSPDAAVDEIRDELEEVSPLTYVDPTDTTPLHLHQGLDDELVVPSTTGRFVDATAEVGQPLTLVEFEDEGHSWGGDPLRHSVDDMYRFFDRELRGEPATLSCSPWPGCEDR